ncbi:MAG: 3'-5' exonuclease, partial [Methanosarcinales archaeon]
MENTTSNIRNIQRSISGLTIQYTNGTKEFKTFNDYFYITHNEILDNARNKKNDVESELKEKQLIQKLKKTIEKLHIPNIKEIQFCKKGIGSYYTEKEICCLKIIVNDFKTRTIADKIKLIKEVQVFEHDVDIGYKYLFAHNINPIQNPELPISVLSLDLETKYERGKELIKQEIISCALIHKTPQEQIKKIWIGYRDIKENEVEVVKLDTEEELIRKILFYLNSLDYDILTGYNIKGFDIPCLIERAQVNNIEIPIKIKNRFINGELINKIGAVVDCYDLVEHKFLGLNNKAPDKKIKSKSLGYIAKTFLDYDKIEYSFLKADKDYRKLMEYNLNDAWLCINLLDKYNYLKEIPAICHASGVLLKDWESASRIHDKIVSREFYKNNYLIPEKTKNKKVNYEGGIVKGESGVYRNVIVFDISSSYPSTIIHANL